MRSVYVCVQRSKQWRVCGHTGRTQLTQLFFPHWRNTNRVLAPHLSIGFQLKGASVARWSLWIFCLYFWGGMTEFTTDDDMFSFWSNWCHETSVRQEHSWPSISGQPHLLFWRAIKCCWLPLLHFVDLPPEPLFAHRQNSSEAPEITITAHTRSRSTLSELLLGANQLNAPPSSSHNTNSNF